MKCQKCGYISFDHLEICQKCGSKLSIHIDTDLTLTPEHKPVSSKSSLKYSLSKSLFDKNPFEKIAGRNSMGSSGISKGSKENDEHSPATSALTHQSDEDDEDSFEETSFSPKEPEEIQTKKIYIDNDKPRGGFWIRALAFIIDLIFINFLITIFSWTIKIGIITGAKIIEMTPETFLDLREFLIITIGTAIFSLYFIYFHGKTGQTPGKSFFHLKVIRTDGSPLGINKAIERFFCYIISIIPLYLGFLMVAFNKEKQALHDIITHTYVIKTG